MGTLKAYLYIVEVHLAYPASYIVYRHSTTIILKQMMQIEHIRIKNPNWQEAASWLFTSRV